MVIVPVFDAGQLEGICKVLGETEGGLSGSEIGQLLRTSQVDDPQPAITKWKRLFEALLLCQQKEQCGNCVVRFIYAACAPTRYAGRQTSFEVRRDELNFILSLCGYELGHNGKLRTASRATTLTEAAQRAGRLKAELSKRTVHSDVLKFCRAELLQDNYFHAVLEATKSVAEKIRHKSGVQGTEVSSHRKRSVSAKRECPTLPSTRFEVRPNRMNRQA